MATKKKTTTKRIPYLVVFWVYDAGGNIVEHYSHKWLAEQHAQRINGTSRRGRY